MQQIFFLFCITLLFCLIGCFISSKKAKKDKEKREIYYKKIIKESVMEVVAELQLNKQIDEFRDLLIDELEKDNVPFSN